MKKNRILSALLCLSLAAGLVIPGLPAYAEGEGESSNSGMKLNKTAVANKNGTYTITLEAYATGQKVISQVNKDVPTDIVLVLDQSGSMTHDIGTFKFEEYKDIEGWFNTEYHTRNRDYYEKRHNGGNANLWHKLDENSYVSVSVTLEQDISYTKITNGKNNSTRDGATNYWYNRNNLYALVNGKYQKVTITPDYDWWNETYIYTYSLPDGTVIAQSSGDGQSPSFTGIDDNVLYLATVDESQNVYTYTYVDADGNIIEIGKSTGADTRFGTPLFQKVTSTSGGGSRLAALKSAVTAFTNSVANKAKGADGQLGTPDDIDHRIAVVGFASGNPSDTLYLNSEVFVGAAQYQYNTTAKAHYSEALQSMKTENGQNNIKASINALDAEGATYTNLGVEMANGILQANPVPNGEKRNRVVIVFTDGVPGRTGYSSNVAESAINQANTSRTLGATVYAVGIFSGADASSAGDSDGNETQKANWFMQNLSDNMGTPQTPSYYLSAADSNTLNNIFQQIADNIESGGTTTTLNESAVIKDIISPQFQLPAGTQPSDITVQTVPCTGITNDVPSWGNPEAFTDAAITVDANTGAVSVSGFDFAGNYVGMDNINGTEQLHNPAKKLVISFNVIPKDGFLGGNNVFTNTSAGVYENANATTPVLEFNRPQVNVPIKDVIVTPQDKNVYLLNGVTLDELKTGATVTVGDVRLDLSADNYGLETWQNEYVDITVAITDKDGNPVPAKLADLTDDTTYTVTVTVTPKPADANSDGTPATAQSKSGTANIKVYKPELTYKDSEVFYGETAPTDFNANLTGPVWKHGNDEADTTTMGTAPDLAITYTYDSSNIADGKINSKQDIQVNATVKIREKDVTGNTTFVHDACNPACGWDTTVKPDGSPAFLLHVKTASLTITKTGISDIDHNESEKQSNIFTVTGQDPAGKAITITLAITGNGYATVKDLPLGSFTVTENGHWCWRYTTQGEQKVTVTKQGASVTFENTRAKPFWLSGDNVKENQFTINGSQG